MTKRPRREWQSASPRFVEPPPVYNVHKPGDKGTSDPFRQFKLRARDDGKPYQSPEPMAERQLLGFLGTNAVVVAMCCVLVAVVVAVLVLVVTKV